MSSYSLTGSATFTDANAKKIASKVATDMKRMQRFYGHPTDSQITDYEDELVKFLKAGYLKDVTYGFKKSGDWIVPTLRYTSRQLADIYAGVDDDPGKIQPGADISGSTFHSYMNYSNKWDTATDADKLQFNNTLPFQRAGAPEPGLNGYMINDKSYSAGTGSVDRSILKKY